LGTAYVERAGMQDHSDMGAETMMNAADELERLPPRPLGTAYVKHPENVFNWDAAWRAYEFKCKEHARARLSLLLRAVREYTEAVDAWESDCRTAAELDERIATEREKRQALEAAEGNLRTIESALSKEQG
jgi:hypothetical protein